MTHDEYCGLLGEKDVQIYLRNLEIAKLQKQVEELERKLTQLLQVRPAP